MIAHRDDGVPFPVTSVVHQPQANEEQILSSTVHEAIRRRVSRAFGAATFLGLLATTAGAQDTTASGPSPNIGPRASNLWTTPADTTRPRSIELSAGYYKRLGIHRVASYAALPLFAGEYLLGEKLLDDDDPPGWVKGAHGGVALALGGIFVTNTVTGVWNLWEARRVPAGRTRRILHTALMLAADAGFVYTATLAGDAGKEDDGTPKSPDGARKHRNAAIVSLSLATVSTVMMWIWKG
jgi:hypothetical protein